MSIKSQQPLEVIKPKAGCSLQTKLTEQCPMAFSITSCKAAVLFALAVLSVHSILPIAAAPVPPTSSSPERDLYLGLKALFFYAVSESSRFDAHDY